MPNHVYNKLTGPKKVLEKYLTDGKFDFRKILPIPKHAKEPKLPWNAYDELRNLNDTQKSKIINEDEHNSLKIFIFNNAPKRENSNFSWYMHDWVSRKKWLKKQIEKL